jgi:dolichyl-phosphate-mannose--protein O-mannosyl transferase
MNKNLYRLGMLGIFLLALGLRFWGINRFNTLVFDEVYYAQFGNDYLTHTPFFNAHPPLSQYIISIGIWIGSHLPFGRETVNGLTGSLLAPWNYRWTNALFGSFVPVLVVLLTYQLSYQRAFALIAGFFTACDGLFLVESRYALSDIYIIFFGLLGQWLFLLALEKQKQQRYLWLILAGITFGAAVGTKWNGLFFLIGIYGIWIIAWVIKWLKFLFPPRNPLFPQLRFLVSPPPAKIANNRIILQTPLKNLLQINIFQMLSFLGIIPAAIYSLIWIPHLQLDRRYDFIEVHRQIWYFHAHLGGNLPSVHPYCAAWYKWPLMTRPMAYYYQTAHSFTDPIPVLGPALPSQDANVIYDVHAMGNPFLWWFGLAAIIFIFGLVIAKIIVFSIEQKRFSFPTNLDFDTWICLYLIINYLANLSPWIPVTRCAFIYHYMGGLVFLFMAIAWLVDQCLRSYFLILRGFAVTISFIIIGAFVFWMPIYLGLPLSTTHYHWRMWFTSWI